MGTKINLLDFLIPNITKELKKGDTVLDIMAGTNSIGYALKSKYRIFSNDVQTYSYWIGKALIENNEINISRATALKDLEDFFFQNKVDSEFNLFEKLYSDTYFSSEQCKTIDNVRFAIEQVENEYKKALYLTSLMYSMSYAQSTTGHFAQYMPMTHKRIVPLRQINIWEAFLTKCDEIKVVFSNYQNKCFNNDYKDFFSDTKLKDVLTQTDLVYLDPPYTEQYSRFYHILETLVKYDYPETTGKGKYRKDRYMSGFSRKSKVRNEFEFIIKNIADLGIKLVISYSNKGIMSVDDIEKVCNNSYGAVKVMNYRYAHSTQGKGNVKVDEVLFICK